MSDDCVKLAVERANDLDRRAQEAWDAGHGRGTSKLPALVKRQHLQRFGSCKFAAREFRNFASELRKQTRKAGLTP